MQSVQQNRDSWIICCWVRWLKHSRASLIFTILSGAAEVAFCCVICVFIYTSWRGGKNWIHWANLEAEGFVGCGEGTDWGAMGNRAAEGEQADHGWARDLWREECSLALDLAYLFLGLLLIRNQYSVCQPYFYLHSAESLVFFFNKCRRILKLTCAVLEWYFFPRCDSVSPQFLASNS